MLTRTLVFLPINEKYNGIRGTISLSGEGVIQGNLKLFNIDNKYLPITLAIQVGDKKTIFTNINVGNDYLFHMVGNVNEDILAIICSFQFDSMQTIAVAKNTKSNIDYAQLFEYTDNEIENNINNTIMDSIQENINNLDTFSGDDNLPQFDSFDMTKNINKSNILSEEQESIQDNSFQTITKEKPIDSDIVLGDTKFYNLVAPQLNELFQKYPRFNEMEKNVDNTEWIKISYSDNGNSHYILGKLYQNGVVAYLCYGIPSESRFTPPPNSLVEYSQWLPLNLDDVDGCGYWVMYQSAETGENVRL